MEFMNNWENVFNEIKHELAEQERIVNTYTINKDVSCRRGNS